MTSSPFEQLEALGQAGDHRALVSRLIELLQEHKDYHRLFDALLVQKKLELGLPLSQPTSFDDVPEEQRLEFEQAYVDAARQVGQFLLADDQITQAWVYFRTIQETEPVADALDAFKLPEEYDNQVDELINLALYEGANPVRGIEFMLQVHGTCNTITSVDQLFPQFDAELRKRATAVLVGHLYQELLESLTAHVLRESPSQQPGESVRELMTDRDWLFADGGYHVDVSHLSSVLRFARCLNPDSECLPLVLELCEYGARLDSQLQYPGEPPFEDFFGAHLQYFRAIAGGQTDEALDYFLGQLTAESDEQGRQLTAFALVDLLMKIDRPQQALEIAGEHLHSFEQPGGFSYLRLCRQVGSAEEVKQLAQQRGDLVAFAAALIEKPAE